MLCVVLAGGLATRMHPMTLTTPKALLEVAGRPFVDWQVERLAACGFTNILFCVAFLADAIEQHLGDGKQFGVQVRYSREGEKLLGTAGAMRAALPLLEPTFLVTYGDSWLPFDYAAPLKVLESHNDCDGVMTVFRNNGKWDKSNVRTKGEWVLQYEKTGGAEQFDCIDYGAIALRRDVIAALPVGKPIGLDTIQHDLAKLGLLRAFSAQERFFEIGSPEGLIDLDKRLRSGATS